MTELTDRPWAVDYASTTDCPQSQWIVGPAVSQENAEHIVRCVNAHDELVAVLDDMHLFAGALMLTPGDPDLVAKEAERLYFLAETALAKARGES